MGHFATGVAVVTVDAPGGPQGMTANAVARCRSTPCSCSSASTTARARCPRSGATERFGVNVLAAGQEHLARRFASKDGREVRRRRRTRSTTASPCSTARSRGSAASSTGWCPAAITRSGSARSHAAELGADGREPLVWFRGGYTAL